MNQPWFTSYEPLVPHTLTYLRSRSTFLTESARKYPYKPPATLYSAIWLAGVHGGGKLTYRKLTSWSIARDRAVSAGGVGRRVALMLPNSPHL